MMAMPLFATPNVRDLLPREHKEKIPPDLKRALALLRLKNYEELQERFLSADAFLMPWSTFRDAMYLFSPDAITRATKINVKQEDGPGISRLDILWFYTQFDEGKLRYDPRADKWSEDFTPDSSVYGIIDKSKWCVEDYEKHLYAWLLQEFKVGKGHNLWKFDYLEYKSICAAWVEVFIPIVNAVRASYHAKGKKHYGQLATFVESKCPSRVAFPDSNVHISDKGTVCPVPYRVVSVPRRMTDGDGHKIHQLQEDAQVVLVKKHYDETEKVLRDVYPQYGGLVERPKFKHKMEEWLAEQRARAELRRAHDAGQDLQPVQKQLSQRSPRKKNRSESPIKRYSDSLRYSLTRAVSSIKVKEEQKNPLHGVTRQLHFPESSTASKNDGDGRHSTPDLSPLPCPEDHRDSSEGSAYSSEQLARSNSNDDVFSAMGQLSAVPRPLHLVSRNSHIAEPSHEAHPAIHAKGTSYSTRAPSYEGTGYQEEISLTNLHAGRTNSTPRDEAPRKMPATRLPAPIIPIPYGGARVASADTPSKSGPTLIKPVLSPPKPAAMLCMPVLAPPKNIIQSDSVAPKTKASACTGRSAPKTMAWPGFDSDDEDVSPSIASTDMSPAIPPRSPERRKSSRAPSEIRNPRARQLVDDAHELQHIVSKENIRAVLGRASFGSVDEEEVFKKPFAEPVPNPSPMKIQLQPFNRNMFPRKQGRNGSLDPAGMPRG